MRAGSGTAIAYGIRGRCSPIEGGVVPREHSIHGDRPVRIAVLATLVAGIALLHFLIPTTSHGWHELHIVVRKLYFLPPVVAAVWFGFQWCHARAWRPCRSDGMMRPRPCRLPSARQLRRQRLREFFRRMGFMHRQTETTYIGRREACGGHARPHARTCALTSDGPGIMRRKCARDIRIEVGPLRRRSSRRPEIT